MYVAIYSFPSERAVINRERASGLYHLSAYYLTRVVCEMPLLLTLPTLYTVISFWMSNLSPSFADFMAYWALIISLALAGQATGFFIGATFRSFRTALTFTTLYSMAQILVAGYMVKQLPTYVSWVQYLSVCKYGLAATELVIFSPDSVFPCTDKSYAPCADASYVTGAQIIDFENVTGSLGFNISMIWVNFVLFTMMTYFSLRYLNRKIA